VALTTITCNGVSVRLDAEQRSRYNSPLKITNNPIESGSQISDNAVLEPRTIHLSGAMVDYNPLNNLFSDEAQSLNVREPDFIDTLPLPSAIKSVTSQTVAYANRMLDEVASTASRLVGGDSGQRALAAWLPELLPVGAADLGSSDQRVVDIYNTLRSFQQSASFVTISSPVISISNALITAVDVSVSVKGAAMFQLTISEVFVVTSQMASGVSVPKSGGAGTKKGGRTSKQSSTTSNKGEVTPQPVTDALSSVIGDAL
jgi:hypothetical protein